MKKLLVINAGSSTLKADVFVIEANKPVFLAKALAEKFDSFDSAIRKIISDFTSSGALQANEIAAIGHRVVHGGAKFSAPTLITGEVSSAIMQMSVFAPLHNPANLAGIEYCQKNFSVPQVAVFDTAFHQTMPRLATTYAIPHELSEKYGIRRYGFHGISHEYVTRECARRMNIRYEEFNAISLHLGNGASACAVQNGKSVDTSMGFTPLEGLVMGTRSGDIDPSLPFFLQNVAGLSAAAAESLLNKESGLLGLAGTSDMREIGSRAVVGDQKAMLAIDIFCTRVRKYIGAYLTWGKPHAIIFTGGIGENSPPIRGFVLAGLPHLGISFSFKKNENPPPDGCICDEDSLPIYMIKTNEELMIARAVLGTIPELAS